MVGDMIEKAVIIPTGDELYNGTVLDTDSPMIMQALVRLNGNCLVTRRPVVRDAVAAIEDEIRLCARDCPDLIVIIGGSGSGHLHSDALGKDHTHQSMENVLAPYSAISLYGKNGHMWSRIICGRIGGTMVINVPGPFAEAKAAIEAFLTQIQQQPQPGLHQIDQAMAEAVKGCYGPQ